MLAEILTIASPAPGFLITLLITIFVTIFVTLLLTAFAVIEVFLPLKQKLSKPPVCACLTAPVPACIIR